jgi:2-oxoglutarate dehydrogenase E2 component (dihydrolipoamide succinyltransferase)
MISITVPPLGESITEATVSRWLRKEGEAIAAGETLVELETDKITVEVPALKAGVLTRRGKSEGDVVAVGDALGEMDESGTVAAVVPAAPAARAATPPAAVVPAAAAPAAAVPIAAPPVAAAEVRSMPSARRAADEAGVNIAEVPGTGRGGVVSKPDVLDFIAARQGLVSPAGGIAARIVSEAAAPPSVASTAPTAPTAPTAAPVTAAAAPAPAPLPPLARPSAPAPAPVAPVQRERREKMTTRRKRIAENLLQAQHATAHLTTFNEIDMTEISALRVRMKDRAEKEFGVKISFMPFFAKASVLALKAFPVVNAQLDGDSIVYKEYVNLGIAVASEAGLVVPNVKDADRLGLIGITREIAAVAKRARDAKLTMDDLTGGTFTITNGGVFGSLLSTPIINYPQVAILGLHKIQDRPMAVDGSVEIRPMMYTALSYDHRIVDGQQAVLFLVKLKELMEDPASMLLD